MTQQPHDIYLSVRSQIRSWPSCDHGVVTIKLASFEEGMVATIAGAIGLWAVYNRSAFAAKVYLYTWPLKLLLHYASLIAFIFVLKSHGLEQLAAIFIFSETLYLVIFAYYTKVIQKDDADDSQELRSCKTN